MPGFTELPTFGRELINFMNTISNIDDSVKSNKSDKDYCERCGRLGQCSQFYVCEFTTDTNGYYLSHDESYFDSSDESSDESDYDSSDSYDEGPMNLEELLDILNFTCKKCWRYGHVEEECTLTTHILGHKLEVYL